MSSESMELELKEQPSYTPISSPATSHQPHHHTPLSSPSVPYSAFVPSTPTSPSITTTKAGEQLNPTGATAVIPAAAYKTERVNVWRELYANPRLLLVIVFACFGGLLFGYDTGIIGGVTSLDDFRQQFGISLPNDSGVDTQATADEISWIVSSFLLGAAASAIVTGPTADVISRKWTIFWGAVLFTIGGILQGSAYGMPQLIIGRVVAGLAVGSLSTIIPIYNAELSSPEVRGVMNTLFQLAITAGILLAFLLNLGFKTLHPYGWRLSLSIQSAFSLVLVFGTLVLPESPRWYMVKRREAEATAVLARLRNPKPVDPEMAKRAIILAAIGAGEAVSTADTTPAAKRVVNTFNEPVERTTANSTDFNVVKIPTSTLEQEVEEMRASILHQERIGESHWRDVFSTPLRARVALGTGVQGWQQLTGMNAIMYYSTTIFANVGVNSLVTTAITGIINFVATFATLPLIDKYGRVPLLLFGGMGMCLSALAVGILGLYSTSGTCGYLIVVFVCLFVVNFAYSWGPCGWIIPSEVFPLSVRGKAVSLTTTVNWVGNFAIAKSVPYLLSSSGVGPTFLLFFGLLFIIVVFVFTMVPETKGVSLEKMDRIFAVQTMRQYRQYVWNNFHHCLAILRLVHEYDSDELDKQREANFEENKEKAARNKSISWTKDNVPDLAEKPGKEVEMA